jgi:uncharacterized protein (DUF2267 family)
VDHDRFIQIVSEYAEVDPGQAERATHATLKTLGERVTAGELDDVAAQMPPELAPSLAGPREAEGFDAEEFVRRVAQREDVPFETAERHVRAVFAALGQAISPKELSDLEAQLSRDYRPLLPRAPATGA